MGLAYTPIFVSLNLNVLQDNDALQDKGQRTKDKGHSEARAALDTSCAGGCAGGRGINHNCFGFFLFFFLNSFIDIYSHTAECTLFNRNFHCGSMG